MTALLENPAAAPPPAEGGAAEAGARSQRRRAALWLLPPLLIVALTTAYPLVRVFTESLVESDGGRGLAVWSEVLASNTFHDALWRTVQIAVAVTLGCLALGFFLALVLAFVPFPGSTVVGRLIDTILAMPSFLITLAFTFLYGSAGVANALLGKYFGDGGPVIDIINSPTGVILAEITFFTPFVMRPLLAAFAQLPREQLDVAASLGASPLRVIRQVILPETWPALLSGGSLVLLLALNEFGIVLFTGAKDVTTLPALIYTRGIVTFDLAGAAVLATVQIALSLALYGLYRLIFNRVAGGRDAAVDH